MNRINHVSNLYPTPTVYKTVGSNGGDGQNGYLNFGSGDYSDLSSPFDINNGDFFILSVVAQSTEITDCAIAIEQNNLGVNDTRQMWVGLYLQSNAINTVQVLGSTTIDNNTPSYSFLNINLNSTIALNQPALNYRILIGCNNGVGGGNLRLYRTRALNVNDYRIAGYFNQATGTPPNSITNPPLSNRNIQPFGIFYHNDDEIDTSTTLPVNLPYTPIDYGLRATAPTIAEVGILNAGDYYYSSTTFAKITFNGTSWI